LLLKTFWITSSSNLDKSPPQSNTYYAHTHTMNYAQNNNLGFLGILKTNEVIFTNLILTELAFIPTFLPKRFPKINS
jgi:hypothetical protein